MDRPAVWGLVMCACTGAAVPSMPVTDAQTADTPPIELTVARAEPLPPAAPCPSDMVLADGEYCPTPIQICKRWVDPPGPYLYYR